MLNFTPTHKTFIAIHYSSHICTIISYKNNTIAHNVQQNITSHCSLTYMDIKFLSISTFVRRAQKQGTNHERPQGGAK